MGTSRGQGAGGTLPGEMTPQVGVQEPAAVVQVRGRKISHEEDLCEQTSENELENTSHILHRQLQTAPHSYDVKRKVGNREEECEEAGGDQSRASFLRTRSL